MHVMHPYPAIVKPSLSKASYPQRLYKYLINGYIKVEDNKFEFMKQLLYKINDIIIST